MGTKNMMTTNDTEKLVTDNMGYVVTLARQYKSDILTTDDLVSEGAIGLMKAARKWDAGRGKPFVTFAAPYIRRSMEAAIQRLTADGDIRSTDESLPVGSRNNFTLLNVLEDANAEHADVRVEGQMLTAEMVRRMDRLDERQRAVVSRYYGIGAEKQTMSEIAEVLGLKRERVRQVRNQALRKLKR